MDKYSQRLQLAGRAVGCNALLVAESVLRGSNESGRRLTGLDNAFPSSIGTLLFPISQVFGLRIPK